ncbi:MFS transporter [Paractinoplanes abujensis]|uniref:MFS family permease n=1 Tax=Paractinoplanes abujensis TaxID=882441 RepID=A0A7W7CP65_9ACTN|nr:MFS transporter [Actinoplanes abujensis]MBB4690648.1 MFS family permease [Actinoplanes abujensis]GID17939.1 MFS transporter [Actinoplanes abujensis]
MTGGRRAFFIAGGYAAQGLGYAALVTALPQLKERQGVDDTFVSVILLLVCVAAAGGSVLADRVAARLGSRYALAGGLLTVAVGLGLTTVRTPVVLFTAVLILYGVGLGAVDASLTMQGVLVQARLGRSVLNRLFAAYTAAAIAAALLMSAFAAGGAGASVAVGVAALFALLYVVSAWRFLEPARTVLEGVERPAERTRPIIWICGAFVLTGFLADSAVSTWSSIYLDDSLAAPAAVVPLGYAAYQATVLLSRLAGDHLVPRIGRTVAVTGALLVCAFGCALVTVVPTIGAAITGFALTGLGVGLLIPLAFSAAGEATPGHSDAVLARVNLFNYAGALLGAVVIGALSEPIGLRWAFLVPVLGLLLTLPVVRALRHLPTAASSHPAIVPN